MNVGVKRVKVKFPLSKEEANSLWTSKSYDAKKVGLRKRKKQEAKKE